MPRFSICIPNYNYGHYLAQTIGSVLSQDYTDLEVCVSDNASTDDSVATVRAIADERVKLCVNETNLGFAANLDCAARMASGETLITLSSDDLMLPGALETYARLLDQVDEASSVVGSAIRVMDADGTPIGRVAAQQGVWRTEHADPALSAVVGVGVYAAPAQEILAASIRRMRNPLHFATTAFPRELHRRIGGYGGNRLVNPDKWFNWRILADAGRTYFVNADLFGYRWHQQNQSAQQKASGALKFLVDEYMATFQLDGALLERLGLDRPAVAAAFLHNDVVLRGWRDLAAGERREVRRALHWALATYPDQAHRSAPLWALRAAAGTGPLGTLVAQTLHAPAMKLWRRQTDARDGLHDTWSR